MEEAGAVTIIDAGVPAYYADLAAELAEVGTFDPGTTLDVPGALRVIHTPGHTPGSVTFQAPGHDALFVGDALATNAVVSRRHGPQICPFSADPDAALASLASIEQLEAHWLLPGHGSPCTGAVAAAVAAARRVGIGHLARPKRLWRHSSGGSARPREAGKHHGPSPGVTGRSDLDGCATGAHAAESAGGSDTRP